MSLKKRIGITDQMLAAAIIGFMVGIAVACLVILPLMGDSA